MTLSANLGKAAPPHELEVTIEGEKCLLQGQRLSLADWAGLSQVLYRKHVNALLETRDIVGEKELDRRLDKLSRQYIKGQFSFESPRFRSWLQSTEGTAHTLMRIFGIDFVDVVAVLVCPESVAVLKLVGIIINESLPGVARLVKKTTEQMRADPGISATLAGVKGDFGVPDPNVQAPESAVL